MANLADAIEQYLKELLQNSQKGSVDVQRAQLAERFSCAPSQINYVLATRFLLEHGYLVETRRGGGGFIRITLLGLDSEQGWQEVVNSIGERIDQSHAAAVVDRISREGLISEREAALMQAALSREVLSVNLPWRDLLRAQILKAMLVALYRSC
jgi:transcriptional regulator CtsR